VAIVTGSGGLIGSESVSHLVKHGYDVIGLENDMRARFFGPEASTQGTTSRLVDSFSEFKSLDVDIRDADAVRRVVHKYREGLEIVIHTAAQPSHDWAASDPQLDFAVNATGTLNVLEAVRQERPGASFVFTSTNKVYGDRPNGLPLVEFATRVDLPADHEYFEGIPTSMSIDRSMHSVFGASKVAADVMVQEYGRYFDIPTVCFRGGCLTGPSHAGAQLHGFLSYLMKCAVTGTRYTVFGYGGKQVRDNIHSADVFQAIWLFHKAPRVGAVYNLGGGRESNVSVLEAIEKCRCITGKPLDWAVDHRARMGDHRWWISGLGEFRKDYPGFRLQYGVDEVLKEIFEANAERWLS
jgi:CDP-paratose 2-epimerase